MSKHPIIVLEGGDGVGKTTLAEKICDYVGGRYLHLTYRFRDRMHLYHGAALKHALLLAETQPVVVDRWWASEVVYADAYRGGSRWPLMYRLLQRASTRHGVSYVFCQPQDREAYLRHFDELRGRREEMYDEGMSRVYDGFAAVHEKMIRHRVPGVSTYDFMAQGGDLDGVVQSILETAEDERALLPDYAKDPHYANVSGSPARAKVLVVGHWGRGSRTRVVGEEEVLTYRPMAVYDQTVLRWTQALEFLDIPEVDVCYVDLMEGEDMGQNERVVREVARHAGVVALGDITAACLEDMGVAVERELPDIELLFDEPDYLDLIRGALT